MCILHILHRIITGAVFVWDLIMATKRSANHKTVVEHSKPDLVVAVSSRALFDLDESHKIYKTKGLDAFSRYQRKREDEPLERGVAFSLVKKLLSLNSDDSPAKVEVVLVSRNNADTGLRIFNSIEHYGLNIVRAVFSGGEPISKYMDVFEAHLFLSANSDSVRQALDMGKAAATVLPSKAPFSQDDDESSQVRIAFDGDAVLFSDESEIIFKTQGLQAFDDHERKSANVPMMEGPFGSFLRSLHALMAHYPADDCPIRTALVTSRGAPSHKRVIHTLRDWGIRIDEAMFLGGFPKDQILRAFGPDIFFDDQRMHCEAASEHVPSGHVPHGVANKL